MISPAELAKPIIRNQTHPFDFRMMKRVHPVQEKHLRVALLLRLHRSNARPRSFYGQAFLYVALQIAVRFSMRSCVRLEPTE
jgi:hypothetical protein